MKDNNLLIILVVVLILVVCYFMYKKCLSNKTTISNSITTKTNTTKSNNKSNFQNTELTKEDNLSIIKFLQKTGLPFVIKNNYTNDGYIYSINENKFKSVSSDSDEDNNKFIFKFDETNQNYTIEQPESQNGDDIFYYYDMEYYLPNKPNNEILSHSDPNKREQNDNYLNLRRKHYYSRVFMGNDTNINSILKDNIELDMKNKINTVSIKIPQQSNNVHIPGRFIYLANTHGILIRPFGLITNESKRTNDSYHTISQTKNFGSNNYESSKKLKSDFNNLYHNYYFNELVSKNKDNIKQNHKLRFSLDEKGLFLLSDPNNKPYGVFYNNTPLYRHRHDNSLSTDYLETISFTENQLKKNPDYYTHLRPSFENMLDTNTYNDITTQSFRSILDGANYDNGVDDSQTGNIKYKKLNGDDVILKDKGGLIRDNETVQFTKKTKVAEPVSGVDNTYKFFDDNIGKINQIYPRYTLHTLFVPIGKQVSFDTQNDSETYLTNDYIAVNALVQNSKNTTGDLSTKKNKIFSNNDILNLNYKLMNVSKDASLTVDNHRSSIDTMNNIRSDYGKLSPLTTSSLYIDRIYCPDEVGNSEQYTPSIGEEKHISKTEYNFFDANGKEIKKLFGYGEKKGTDTIQANLNNVIAHQTCKLFNYNNRFQLLDNTDDIKKKYLIVDNVNSNLGMYNQDLEENEVVSNNDILNTPYFVPKIDLTDETSIINFMISKTSKSMLCPLSIVNDTSTTSTSTASTSTTDDKLVYVKTNPINFIKSYYNDMRNNDINIELSPNMNNIFKIRKTNNNTGEDSSIQEYYIVKREGNIFYFLYETDDGLEFITNYNDSQGIEDKYLFTELIFKNSNNNVPRLTSDTIEHYFTEDCTITVNNQDLSIKNFLDTIKFKRNSNIIQLLINYIFNTSLTNNDFIPENIFDNIPENPSKWFGLDKDLRIRLNDLRVIVYNKEEQLFELVDETTLSEDELLKYEPVYVLNNNNVPNIFIGYDMVSLRKKTFNMNQMTISGTSSFQINKTEITFFYRLKNVENDDILHLVYKNHSQNEKGRKTYEIRYLNTIRFYSIYDNGELVESYSPYINAANNEFVISDPKIKLNNEPYSNQIAINYPENIIQKYYYLNANQSPQLPQLTNKPDMKTITPKFIMSILNTPIKSGITIQKENICTDSSFKIIYNIENISKIKNNSIYDNVNHLVIIKKDTIADDYEKNINNINELFNEEQINQDNILAKVSSLNEDLLIQINNVKKYNETLMDDSKTKLIEINKLGQYFRNIINTEINNKMKKISTVQFNLQLTEKKIRELKLKYQMKVKYSFAITQDKDYLEKLRNQISEMKFSINILENRLNERKSEIYQNYLETNKIISKINNFIYIINRTLKNKQNIQEQFDDSNIYNFNEVLLSNNNILISNLSKLEEATQLYNTRLDERNNYIIEKDKLKTINNFYNNLINSFTNSSDNSIKIIFANIILQLDELEIKILNNLNKSRLELMKWENKYESDDFTPIELVSNPEIVNLLELEIINLEDKKERLNQKINDINKTGKANEMLETLKQINLEINRPQLRDFNPMEAFQNPPFRSAQSHTNHFLSLKPMNNNQYKIRVNDKCLNVYGTNDYSLDDCNLTSSSQLFSTQRINTKIDAMNFNKDQIISNDARYPYNQIKSTISNDCINMDKDGISLSTCSSNNPSQRWNLSREEKKCLDN